VEWPEPDAVVVRDVFPAVVRFGPSTLRNARAVVTRQRVYAWTAKGAPALAMAYDADASTVPRINAPRSAATHLALADGSSVHIEGQRGCGCGNPLRGWVPWRPYRKATA
jgi:hypothetical protein